jgi:CxxC motif-containing protein
MELIPAVLAELRELSPRPPLRAGDLMLANPADCGADILATRDVDA